MAKDVGYKKPPKEHRFTSENQPANRGRKPSRLKEFIESNGLTADDLSNTIKYIFPMTEKELNELGNDPEKPILMRLFVKAIIKDMENSNIYNITQLFNRAFGQPRQELELSTVDEEGQKTGFTFVEKPQKD